MKESERCTRCRDQEIPQTWSMIHRAGTAAYSRLKLLLAQRGKRLNCGAGELNFYLEELKFVVRGLSGGPCA